MIARMEQENKDDPFQPQPGVVAPGQPGGVTITVTEAM